MDSFETNKECIKIGIPNNRINEFFSSHVVMYAMTRSGCFLNLHAKLLIAGAYGFPRTFRCFVYLL